MFTAVSELGQTNCTFTAFSLLRHKKSNAFAAFSDFKQKRVSLQCFRTLGKTKRYVYCVVLSLGRENGPGYGF